MRQSLIEAGFLAEMMSSTMTTDCERMRVVGDVTKEVGFVRTSFVTQLDHVFGKGVTPPQTDVVVVMQEAHHLPDVPSRTT